MTEFEALGDSTVTSPVSSLRDRGTENIVDRTQTPFGLHAVIGYHDYEAPNAAIVTTIIPTAMP